MNCNISNEAIMKYFDGNINDIEKVQLKQHLKTCKDCSNEFESLKDIFNCLEEDTQIEPPVDFELQVMEKINSYETVRRKKVDSFLMLIYGVTVLILGIFTIIFALKVKDSGILNSIGNIESIQEVLWSALYFIYGIFKQLGGYLNGMAKEIIYYYIFVVGLITYLIMQKSSTNTEKNINKN